MVCGQTLVAGVHPVVVPRASARVIHAVPPSTYSGSTVVRRTASLSPIRTSGYGHHHHHHHHHYHPATVRAASPSPSDLLLLSSSVSPPPPAPLSSVHRHHHHLAGGALHTATLLPSDLQARDDERYNAPAPHRAKALSDDARLMSVCHVHRP